MRFHHPEPGTCSEQGMKSLPLIRPQDTHYDRKSFFSYACHGCSHCCYHKTIHLNPYEVARLAQNRAMSTTAFLDRYTAENGTALRQKENGACIFLTPQGCSVHPDRPLVCRLYPLGRRVTSEGEEWFEELAPEPKTKGEYGTTGTVAQFLTQQGARPFIEAVDRYVEMAAKMSHVIQAYTQSDPTLQQHVQDMVKGILEGQEQGVPAILDMDQVVGSWCADRGLPMPSDINEKMSLHILITEEWLKTNNREPGGI